MQERVTEVTKRLALSARLLFVAVAFLLGGAPGVVHGWDADARACSIGKIHDDRRLAAHFGFGKITAADLVATPSSPSSDSDKSGNDIVPRLRLSSAEIEKSQAGYQLPSGQLLATAFAPRGPPSA